MPVACDSGGNIDVADLQAKADARGQTRGAGDHVSEHHGVFETTVRDLCRIVHGGDRCTWTAPTLNAQLGLTSPGSIGADVTT